MNKKALIEKVADKIDHRKNDTTIMVDAVLECIRETLISGESVELSGLGKFEIKTRPARMGINPSNGERISIPEARTVGFKVSKTLKELVKSNG